MSKVWQAMRKEKIDQRKKGFKPPPFQKKERSFQRNHLAKGSSEQNTPSQSGMRGIGFIKSKSCETTREPMKCRGCGGPHLL